jgi:hypothetical protein
MNRATIMSQQTPDYGGYPSSYSDNVFPTNGLAGLVYSGMSGAPDGYVGNATVTTSDPAPTGDLKIHSAPSSSSPQIGGADKDAIVEVVTEAGLPSGWGKVGTFGGGRNPQVVGYAALAYLTPVAGQGQVEPATPAPSVSPVVPNVPGVTPVAPSSPTAPASSSTFKYVAIGGGVLVAAGLAWWLLGD